MRGAADRAVDGGRQRMVARARTRARRGRRDRRRAARRPPSGSGCEREAGARVGAQRARIGGGEDDAAARAVAVRERALQQRAAERRRTAVPGRDDEQREAPDALAHERERGAGDAPPGASATQRRRGRSASRRRSAHVGAADRAAAADRASRPRGGRGPRTRRPPARVHGGDVVARASVAAPSPRTIGAGRGRTLRACGAAGHVRARRAHARLPRLRRGPARHGAPARAAAQPADARPARPRARGARQPRRDARPARARALGPPAEMWHYGMGFFAQDVVALLDHLGVDEAVVGGTSLGANTTLEVAVARAGAAARDDRSRCRCSTTRCSRARSRSRR